MWAFDKAAASDCASKRGQVERWVVSVIATGITWVPAFELALASAEVTRTAERSFVGEETGGGVGLAAFGALEQSVGMFLLDARQTGFPLYL